MSMSNLPKEILLIIAGYLDVAEVNALCQVNSEIYNLLSVPLYRRNLNKSLDWGIRNGLEGTVQWAVDAVNRHWDQIPDAYNIALQDAAEQGKLDLVKLLLKVDGINPNFGDHLKSAPLILAAKNGHSDVVGLLLATVDVDPDVRNKYSASPLIYACQKGHVSIVKQLLNRGEVDLNAVTFYGWSPHTESGSSTPLIAAENLEVVELLLAKDGIDINACNTKGETPLLIAMVLGQAQKIKALLARGDWDPTIVSSKGDHIFPFSVRAGDVGIVKSVLDHPSNIDPNVVNSSNCTALMEACRKGELDVVQFLLGIEGIDVHRQDGSGCTAFCLAAEEGHSQVVKLLLTRDDIDINRPNYNGQTALFLACREACLETVDLILKQDGIDLNTRATYTGHTPLAIACLNNNTDIVRLLLSRPDTDPNPVDNHGASILALVESYYGYIESHYKRYNNVCEDLYFPSLYFPNSRLVTQLAAGAEIRSLLCDAGAIVIRRDMTQG
ncbi:Ankyrin repeat-containing domain protein [Elaphomyces granulatus]